MAAQDAGAPTSITLRLKSEDIEKFAKWQKDAARGPIETVCGGFLLLSVFATVLISVVADFVLGLACGAVVVISLVGLTRLSNSKVRRSSPARAALASGSMTVNDAGVRCESPYGITTYRWNALPRL